MESRTTRSKILIAAGIFPPDIGGPATYVPKIAERLASAEFEVVVVTNSKRQNHDDSKWKFRVVRAPYSTRAVLRIIYRFYLLLKEAITSDIIFSNGVYVTPAIVSKMLRKPFITKIVGDPVWERARNWCLTDKDIDDFQNSRESWRTHILRYILKLSLSSAKKIIVPSNYLRNLAVGWGLDSERLQVIHNAVSISETFRSAAQRAMAEVKLVTASRLVSWKRVDLIIEAVALLKNTTLTVIGDGPELDNLFRLVSDRHITNSVKFTGRLERDDTLRTIAASDVFVSMSEYEGLPHVLVEASILGLPVIARNVGGCGEVISSGVNGYLLADSSIDGLCRAVQNASQLKVDALFRESFKEKFSEKIMEDKTIQLFQKYLTDRK